MHVGDSGQGIELVVLVRSHAGERLNSSVRGKGWLRIIEVLVAKILHEVRVNMADSLGNLRASDTTASLDHLSANLVVGSIDVLLSHQVVPHMVASANDLDLVYVTTIGSDGSKASPVHLASENLVSEQPVAPKTAVRVCVIDALLTGHIWELSENHVGSIVLVSNIVDVLAVLLDLVVTDHVAQKLEGVVVLVVDGWSIVEDIAVGVVALIISHEEKSWDVDALIIVGTARTSFGGDTTHARGNGLDKGVVVDVASSDNDHVVAAVVGLSECLDVTDRDVLKGIEITTDWLSHHVVSESVVMDGLHACGETILVQVVHLSHLLLLAKLKLSAVKSWVAHGIAKKSDGATNVVLEASDVEGSDLAIDVGGDASSHGFDLSGKVGLSSSSRSSKEHLAEEVGTTGGLEGVITGASTDVDTNIGSV